MSSVRDRSFEAGARLLQGAFELDQSTSVGHLGSLFDYRGDKPVQQLKRKLAEAYGVVWSFPSTHGTTALNALALLTVCPPGGRVLVNRDAHSSVTAAIIQGGLYPVYLVPAYDPELGVSLAPTPADVAAILDRERVDCVFLTSPNYFGIVGEIGALVAVAHERGLPVVVDAAHAPHFRFCDLLPRGAEEAGADLVAQSTHKVANALSQGSLLLINNATLIEALYENVSDLGLVSTSFSYPILASIELAVRQLVEDGQRIWSDTTVRAEILRAACRQIPGVRCFGDEHAGTSAFDAFDRTRVTLHVAGTGRTGLEIERELNRRRIYPEMATIEHLLFLVTPGTDNQDVNTLLQALVEIIPATPRAVRAASPPPPRLPKMAMIPRLAKFCPKRTVDIATAIGEVSGETIAAYPPGSPVIVAGEIVTAEVVEYLCCLRSHEVPLKGASDPSLRTLKVL